jgi:Winged helix-turn helix/Integrase core domain
MPDKVVEYGLRCRAIRLHLEGMGHGRILGLLGRGRTWLAKWLGRFEQLGWAGLQAQSREPKRQPRRMPERVVAAVLAIRAELQAHRSRASRFSGLGAEAIRLQLQRRRIRPLPGLRTIERIVQRHALSAKQASRAKAGAQPYPAPRARCPGDLQQTDLVGPRHLRGPRGVIRFYSFHTVAVVGRAVATSQARSKSAEALCAHLVHAWSWLGLPRVAQMDNEMAASGGGRHAYTFSLVMRLHLLLGVHLVFIPEGEPGRNPHVESFNDLWQERVLRHPCADLAALRRTDRAFLRYYHFDKPHRALQTVRDLTRLPGEWLESHRSQLRSLPEGFSLDPYRDRRARLQLPLARGRVSFVRKVNDHGLIQVNGQGYLIGKRLARQYVTATIYPHRQALVVKHEGRVHKQFEFPVHDTLTAPLSSDGRA